MDVLVIAGIWLIGIMVIAIGAGIANKKEEIEREPFIWIVGIIAWPITLVVMAVLMSICGLIRFGIWIGGVLREKVLKKTE